MKRKKQTDNTILFLSVMIVMMVLVLLGCLYFFFDIDNVFHRVLAVTLNIGLIASLLGNFFQFNKLWKITHPAPDEPPPPSPRKPAPRPARRPQVDPKILPDPGLVYRFDMTDAPGGARRIVIGQKQGNIKTYSTEVLDNHLEVEIRIKEDENRDIYDQEALILQQYRVDVRRGGRVMIHYPGAERFREMDARERILIQPEPDKSGDFQYPELEPRYPIRFQLGDRLRHDGKFLKGYFEFHLFTKNVESEKAGYKRLDKQFFLRLYRIFPGYDTGASTDEGLFPMIDPFITR